jgi:ABC-type iron transport system FetAB ATPase subunit
VRKQYGTMEVIHGIDLHIESGEFVVFVGPSGCGKSTLLRMIGPAAGGAGSAAFSPVRYRYRKCPLNRSGVCATPRSSGAPDISMGQLTPALNFV